MEYEHKGVKIRFDEKDGDFMALVGPRNRTFPSLASAKKAIESYAAEAFEPFDAICDRDRKSKKGESEHYEIVRVIGIEKAVGKRSWSNRDKYVFEGGNRRSSHQVLRDTPANRAAFVAWREYEAEVARMRLEAAKKLEKLRDAIKYETLEY